MRECSVSRLAHGQLRWLVGQLMRSDSKKRPAGRSAFVCPGDADYNVLRVLIAYAEANGHAIELAVFRDIDEARVWLFDDRSREALGVGPGPGRISAKAPPFSKRAHREGRDDRHSCGTAPSSASSAHAPRF